MHERKMMPGDDDDDKDAVCTVRRDRLMELTEKLARAKEKMKSSEILLTESTEERTEKVVVGFLACLSIFMLLSVATRCVQPSLIMVVIYGFLTFLVVTFPEKTVALSLVMGDHWKRKSHGDHPGLELNWIRRIWLPVLGQTRFSALRRKKRC